MILLSLSQLPSLHEFSESDNNFYYNIKPNCQKENICTDKQLYSCIYSCGTAHFDGILHLKIILGLIYIPVFPIGIY
jgi:hypothetical protein